MKLLFNLCQTYPSVDGSDRTEWRIRISGKKNDQLRNPRPERVINRFQYEDDMYLIFNPTVSIVAKNKDTKESFSVPLSRYHEFLRKLQSVYKGLQNPKLVTQDEERLYLNAKEASSVGKKLTLYNAVLIMIPAVIHAEDTDRLGIQFQLDGTEIMTIEHHSILELCEVMDRIDIQTITAVISISESMTDLERKMDRILDGQARILALLGEPSSTRANPMKVFESML